MRSMLGMAVEVVDESGQAVKNGESGFIVITEPWPSMLRGIWGDNQRYQDTYWSRFEGKYFPGDGAKRDEDGDIWLLGRVDDVMNVSGHLISTAEVESALVGHDQVAEAAVVGASDATAGQRVVAFVILTAAAGSELTPQMVEDLRLHVAGEIGPIAKPKQIIAVPELPKTRSGKIMRRLLRDAVEKHELGDVTTLTDSGVMTEIIKRLG
jgi:acetyl-CoA synthetase